MRKLLGEHDRDALVLALTPSICALVLIVAVVGPALGWTNAGVVAVVWLLAFVVACLAVCLRRVWRRAALARSRLAAQANDR